MSELEVLGSAGEHGISLPKDIEKYLVDGYLPTIGIECHVQLNTATKLFSSADNDARDAEPNSKISAIDYALPGMLPVLNQEAVKLAARAGKALHARIAHTSRFDRKHYFYPDLPKGYQISQMYQPTIIGGYVNLPPRVDAKTGAKFADEKIRIHHAHIEEDAGKLTHFSDYSLVDLNRAGTPLIEIVGEPDIHSAAAARAYAEELHLLMTYAGVTFGDLYYGNMRFDVNISVAKPGDKLGLRTEIKNLNSFRAVEKATEYEIARQIKLNENGEEVKQETRGWSDDKQQTFAQRSKENAQDYRYMPDADIPPVVLTDEEIEEMQKDFPTMPDEYREKFTQLKLDDSVVGVLLAHQNVAQVIAQILDEKGEKIAKKVANLFASSTVLNANETEKHEELADFTAKDLIELAEMLIKGEISSNAGDEIFAEIAHGAKNPREIAEKKNLLQVSDEGAIAKIVDEVLADPASAKAVADFKAGNEKVIGFLVGQVMKASKSQANPGLAQKLIREKLQ
jgi:aspartyl-tRNA(Asn)/glutamyl-tRNA(Gln) amidotransferase subunit B